MSTYSCGVLARNALNRPTEPGLLVAGGGEAVGRCLQRRRARGRRGRRTISLKPPALPRPSTGGGAEDGDRRLLDFAGSTRPAASRRSRRRSGPAPCRCVELVEDDEHRAEVRADGVLHDRLPGMAIVCATPGMPG